MKTAIAVFCKTPDLSPVKTRLGVEIGKNYAEEFYRLSLSVVHEVILQVINESLYKVDAYWAIAEKEALSHPIWDSFQSVWTGEGGLGERINYVFEQLLPSYDQIIILGSDSPQITADYIINAIERLSQKNVNGVIGPCRDGGFVLFGTKQLLPKSVWTDVIYSQDDTLEQLVILLDKMKFHYFKVPALGDVDTYNDLLFLVKDYIKLSSNLQPQQRKLFNWMHDILITRRVYQKVQLSKLLKITICNG